MPAKRQRTRTLLHTLPPEIANSPLLAKKKIGAKSLPKYVQDIVQLFTPTTLPTMMASLVKELNRGNMKAIRLAAELYGLVATPGGTTFIQNIQQMAMNGGAAAQPISMDSIVRDLDDARRNIIDVTPEPMQIEEP